MGTGLGALMGAERRGDYDCRAFASDVWEKLGRSGGLRDLLFSPSAETARGFEFCERDEAQAVIFNRCGHRHIGILISGKVLHLRDRFPSLEPVELAGQGFKTAKFFKAKVSK